MRKLKYNGSLGPDVRAGGVNQWLTGEVHEIQHDGVAESLMQSGRFEDVTPTAAAPPPKREAGTESKAIITE